MVNFRFLIVGGSCARSHYRNVPSKKRQELLIPVVPGLELKLDLEFGDQSLKRIVAYLDHPSSIYFNNTIGFTAPSPQLDAGSNLFLWLLGRPHDPVAFRSFFDEEGFRRPRAAFWSDMWSFLRREKALGRTLQQEEYSQSFLTWSRGFLGYEFSRGRLRAKVDRGGLHRRSGTKSS